VVAYHIASSLAVKPESAWNSAERAHVEAFHEWRQLEETSKTGMLSHAQDNRLKELRELRKHGKVVSYVTALDESLFHAGVFVVIGAYLVFGGMVLVPIGLQEVGGWSGLAARVPPQMFDLIGAAGSEQFSLSNVLAILLISLVQINGHSHNMGLSGSAQNEMAARFSVTGTYLKRVITIVWALVGLIAIAIFGPGGLADPDAVWGELSHRLIGPGLIGLMLAGVLAGTMALVSVKTLAIASLLVCNVVRHIRPEMTPAQELRVSHYAAAVILTMGVGSAWLMGDFLSIANLALTINLPFGAAIMLIFFWRRLSATAVWWAAGLSIVVSLVVPWTASSVPVLREAPSLLETRPAPSGKMSGVYFASVGHASPDDLTSPLVGRGRFNFECWLLGRAGMDVAALTPLERLTAQFLVDALLPFAGLLAVSLLTRPTDPKRLDLFYGKMKTPVGETPELEATAMAQTCEDPRRFNHTKLFPTSSWEFCCWDRTDTWGFIVCCAASAALLGLFAGILFSLKP
jgi:hypothetical protein